MSPKINFTNIENLDVLFFGAHPDDVELSCGGTIIKLVQSKKKIGIVDLTLGELSTKGNLQLRKRETEEASNVLGISYRENLKIKDGDIQLNQVNKEKIISVIRKYKPKLVFAPFPFDRHPDHVNASNLIKESIFFSGLMKFKTANLKAYRPSKVFYYQNAYDIPVSFIFDISTAYQKKLKAIKCYSSQFYNPKSKEPETFISSKLFEFEIESRARHYGFKIGVEFGEPFFSYETIKVDSEILFRI